MWRGRIDAWHASGESLTDYCRGKEFTRSAVDYWLKRLGIPREPPQSPKPPERAVRLARVVRAPAKPSPSRRDVVAPTKLDSTEAPVGVASPLVVEILAIRVHVPNDVEGSCLDSVLGSLARTWKAGPA